MKPKLYKGFALLEKELKQLNSTVKDIENSEEISLPVNKSLRELTDKLIQLQLPNEFNKLSIYINSLSKNVQNMQGRFDSLESNLINKNVLVEKEITDEIGMLTIGMNNINHYLTGAINENEGKYDDLENSLIELNKKNKFTNWLIITLLAVVVFEFIIFFK